MLGGVVRRAHQWSRFDPAEADSQAKFLQLGELFHGVVTGDGQMLARGLEILPNGEDIHTPRAQIAHHILHLFDRLTQAHHQARFGQHVGIDLLGVGEGGAGPIVAILRLHELEQSRNRLYIVIEDLGPGVDHDTQRFRRAFEVGNQHFDRAAGVNFANAADEHGEDRRAAIFAVVAVHRGDHRVLKVHRLHCLRHAVGLHEVERSGAAAFDVAETTGAGADVAHH